MARDYRLTPARRLANSLMTGALRAGIAPGRVYLLTVPGRKSGRRYSTPVQLVEENADRFLVAPYGEREWVKNARAAGWVELARGRRTERLVLDELTAAEAAPVLKRYVQQVGMVVRPFFDAGPDDPVETFAAEAAQHPVFRLTSANNRAQARLHSGDRHETGRLFDVR
jgi:deazaflavin-dependent oxidoreductase (nitroreductase family)